MTLRGQLRHDPPIFDGKHYAAWRKWMREYLISQDFDMWMIVAHGPCVPSEKENGVRVPSDDKNICTMDLKKRISSDYKAKLILTDALTQKEYNKVGTCQSAKEIWDTLEAIYGNFRVVEERLYELKTRLSKFRMKPQETVSDMHGRFMKIITEMCDLGEEVKEREQVERILCALPEEFEKVRVAVVTQSEIGTPMTVVKLIVSLAVFEMRHSTALE